jgi:hypothetical protein
MKRRSFLQLFGAGALSGRKLTEEALLRVTGVSTPGFGSNPHISAFDYGPPIDSSPQKGDYEFSGYDNTIMAASKYVKTMGMPEFYDRQLRRRASEVYRIDGDIACKCWSWNVKLQSQRERNYQRLKSTIEDAGGQAVAKNLLWKFTGFQWPWH